jgi:hypothetical protein
MLALIYPKSAITLPVALHGTALSGLASFITSKQQRNKSRQLQAGRRLCYYRVASVYTTYIEQGNEIDLK